MIKPLCLFKEMYSSSDTPFQDFLTEKVDYDKDKVIAYLKKWRRIASCPSPSIDCMTGKEISRSKLMISDGEYEWLDCLPYHVKKYNIKLPPEFIRKAIKG